MGVGEGTKIWENLCCAHQTCGCFWPPAEAFLRPWQATPSAGAPGLHGCVGDSMGGGAVVSTSARPNPPQQMSRLWTWGSHPGHTFLKGTGGARRDTGDCRGDPVLSIVRVAWCTLCAARHGGGVPATPAEWLRTRHSHAQSHPGSRDTDLVRECTGKPAQGHNVLAERGSHLVAGPRAREGLARAGPCFADLPRDRQQHNCVS